MPYPKTQVEYVSWAKETLNIDYEGAHERAFRSNSAFALLTVQRHQFFQTLGEYLEVVSGEYAAEHRSPLLMNINPPELFQKSYESAINKSYRLNAVWNRRFPNNPQTGWVTPANWYILFDDLIRGTLVCKYLDGPPFLAKRLEQRAQGLGLACTVKALGRDEGYYAYHFHVKIPVDLVDAEFNEHPVDLSVEIQLTTQLQEVLYNITHKFYEQNRLQRARDTDWKWDHGSNLFKAAYVSHTLHMLEATILELRDSEVAPQPQPEEKQDE